MKDRRVALDVTAQQRSGGGGMDLLRLWLCGHKGGTTGAQFRKISGRQPIAWRCAACVAALEEAA